jgi:hypothetical protein
MNWFNGLDAVVRRAIAIGSLVLALIVVGLVVGYCSQRDATRQAEGKASVAASQGNLGADALSRADDLNAANREGEAQTGRNTDFITGADNAKTDAGQAGDRGRLVFCDRQRVRGKPEPEYCPRLRGAYPAQP